MLVQHFRLAEVNPGDRFGFLDVKAMMK